MIIGVVAAMTIPGLKRSGQERELHTALKKGFSTLNQGLGRAELELGYTPRCFYGDDGISSKWDDCSKQVYLDAFRNSFNFTMFCDQNAFANGCIPNYKGVEEVMQDKGMSKEDADEWLQKNCLGFSASLIKSGWAIVLADGMIIFPYRGAPLFAIDVNGKKPPNKWGYDVFSFEIHKSPDSGTYFKAISGCMAVEAGGKTVSQILGNQ